MLIFWLALLSAFGCALFSGTATVLQKISADRQARATSLHAGFLWGLLQDWPFLVGLALDGLAWIMTLIAVHNLPLFVVQPIIALGVVVVVVIERLIWHRQLGHRALLAFGLIIIGIGMLALQAAPETSNQLSGAGRTIIILTPFLLALLGAIFARINKPYAVTALAAIAGIAFAGTSIVGRVLKLSSPYWHLLFNPLIIALLAYGVIGILLFSIALQRHHASVVNAAMITVETIVPITVGILLLGDRPKHGAWVFVVSGAAVALAGTLLITLSQARDNLVSSKASS